MKTFLMVQVRTSTGALLNKWRMVERTHTDGNVTEKNLCKHKHDSPEEARACPSVIAQIPQILNHRRFNPKQE